MTTHEKPAKKEKSPTRRILALGAGILGIVFGAEFLKGFIHHN